MPEKLERCVADDFMYDQELITSVNTIDDIFAKIKIIEKCWEWTGTLNPGGYGSIMYKSHSQGIHRHVYAILNGPIPERMEIDHLCRNRKCCNPNHLELVTKSKNLQRGKHSNQHKNKTHCVNNHEFTPENTYMRKHGGRSCRTCKKLRQRERKLIA